MKSLFFSALLAGAAVMPVASAQTPAAALTPGADVRVDVLQLESDPPGNIKEAPGGGRTLAPAMLYTPAKGANIFGPAIVMLDDGPASHPLARGQAARFAAERLAAQGYTVLSIYTGQERNFPTVPFADNKWAVKGAIDYLAHAGYEDIALAGQGYGALLAADYLKNFADQSLDNGPEKRVKGLILINPLLDLKQFPNFGHTKGYDARVALTRQQMADGSGKYLTSLEPGHSTGKENADWLRQGDYVGPAQAWLDYWGPDAAARNEALLKSFTVPTIIIAGDKVGMSPAAKVQAMKAANVDVALVPGGGVDLSPVAQNVTDNIASWLKAHDLGVRPGVKIRTADITTDGGVPLFGMVYDPEGGVAPNKPVIMLIHGRAADTLQSSTHWMGWRFAQAGYRAIAPSMQISGTSGIETKTITDVQADIGHWMDWASRAGAKRVVLTGHSQGGIFISNYEGNTQDKRVAGMIYIAPTADAAEFQKRLVGAAAYAKDNARAEKAIKEGRGLDEVLGVATATSWYDLYGAKARTVHSERVKEFNLPAIAFAGGKDPIQADWFLDRFTKGYRGKLELKRYPEGTHGFRESKDRLVGEAVDWLRRTFP
ncbi:alpha/beta fold hydrolase [Sphingobium aromaticivastans]|uniref:alpha/beta hydrolase n=1 Tax=Sphingobium aromaticivastans TaxID=1778665 RepID=UPI00301AD16C